MQLTPAMQQYMDVKKKHPDCILFFRIGDFYETFFEDAKICHKVLDLILTSKNKDSDNPIPMAGIPHHSVDKYIPKLVAHGYKIAIAEQTSEPIPGKIVQREISRIITPGTYLHEQKKTANTIFACCFLPSKSGMNFHCARGDVSLGEYQTKSFTSEEDLQKHIFQKNPVEIIFDIDLPNKEHLSMQIKKIKESLISIHDIPSDPEKLLLHQCKIQTLASYGEALQEGRQHAMALLISYIQNNQHIPLQNIARISREHNTNAVIFDEVSIKNLEIFSAQFDGSNTYSLIGCLDTSKTAAGSRLFHQLICNPIHHLWELNKRLSHIQYYTQHDELRHDIQKTLHNLGDIPKIISSILYKKTQVSWFLKLRANLAISIQNPQITQELLRLGCSESILHAVQNFTKTLQTSIKDEEEIAQDSDYIREGVDKDLDSKKQTAFHSDTLLLTYQQELIEKSGIANVKVKFIINQGFFIEITNKDIEIFEQALQTYPSSDEKRYLVRRNTLKGWQRFTSKYLDSIQDKILDAKEAVEKQELEILETLKQQMITLQKEIHEITSYLAQLDVYTAHAQHAKEKKRTQPILTDNTTIKITQGRHPIIEEHLPREQQFIPNNVEIWNPETGDIHIITWPNMGGKSTYLRQNAIIVLLAHCGFFVPAQEAEIWCVDGIFARVGSGDIIAKNQSTFMTEMIEVANIINNASAKSFIIFDELGRGTSTYDGLALTKAILHDIASNIHAKTLIATHYHELISLEKTHTNIRNFSVSVYETDKEVVFLKKIIAWWASKSYGIDVAQLAGIPSRILQQAKQELEKLTDITGSKDAIHRVSPDDTSPVSPDHTSLISAPVSPDHSPDPELQHLQKIKSLIASYDINNITPLQALQILAKIKEK